MQSPSPCHVPKLDKNYILYKFFINLMTLKIKFRMHANKRSKANQRFRLGLDGSSDQVVF